MLDFARKNSPFGDIRFIHQDATQMENFQDSSFDYVIATLLVHELNRDKQLKLINEAWRVGRNVILLDSNAPLPWNLAGIIKRVFEVALGYEHYSQFRAYLAGGGILGILQEAGLAKRILHRQVYSFGGYQIVMVGH